MTRSPAPILSVPWLRRVAIQGGHRFWRNNCTQSASSLAYQTALALVPLLAVAFALLKASGQLDAQSTLLHFLGRQILPSSDEARQEIIQRLASYTEKVAAGAVGGLALLVTIATSFTLFLNVEGIWNRIWCVPRQRTYLNKFLLFYASITLGPLALALSLYYTTALWNRISVGEVLLSLLGTPVALTLANRALPLTRVSWRAAGLGGLSSGLLFELAKYGFGLYLAWATSSYRSIYGALGILPLFLFWIYVAWLIVLLGAEIAHAAERLEALEAAARREAASGDGEDDVLAGGALGARVLLDIVRHYKTGAGPLSAAVLEARHALTEQVVRRLLRRLEDRKLVIAVGAPSGKDEGYLPARPAQDITVDEVLEAFAPPRDVAERDDALGRLLAELHGARRARTGALTLADLT